MLSLALIDHVEQLGIFETIGQGVPGEGDGNGNGNVLMFGMVGAFFTLMRRPLLTLAATILISIYSQGLLVGGAARHVNCIMASLIVGSIGSLTFHQFAQAASESLTAMLYCWSLDEAL